MLRLTDQPLSSLGQDVLRPSPQALDEIMEALR